MALHFPNPSRSYDAAKSRVRFWGHDGVIEISFFLEADALQKLAPVSLEMSGIEAGILKAFDAARDRIYAVAAKIYARDRNGSFTYRLAAADFK